MSYVILVIVLAAVALAALSAAVLILVLRRRPSPLPDGDYVIRVEGVRKTATGDETVYVVESPKEFEGHKVVIHSKEK